MALVAGDWILNVTLGDTNGDSTTRTYEMDVADAAEAATAATAVLAAIANVTDCVIRSYFYAQRFIEDANLYPLVAGTQVENQAILAFSIVGDVSKTATTTIPGPKPAIFVGVNGPNSKVIDTNNLAVIAFRSLFQTGNELFISDGEKALLLKAGKRRHVKNSNG